MYYHNEEPERGCLLPIISWTIVVALAIGNIFLEGYVFQQMYGWFLFNIFNAPAISYWQSMGICIIISFVLMGVIFTIKFKSEEGFPSGLEMIGREIGLTLLILAIFGCGAIAQLGI